jgi:hypothetical protein
MGPSIASRRHAAAFQALMAIENVTQLSHDGTGRYRFELSRSWTSSMRMRWAQQLCFGEFTRGDHLEVSSDRLVVTMIGPYGTMLGTEWR